VREGVRQWKGRNVRLELRRQQLRLVGPEEAERGRGERAVASRKEKGLWLSEMLLESCKELLKPVEDVM
jgi:hypothetical protein